MPDPRLAEYRKRLGKRRRQNNFIVRRINVLKAAIAKRKKELAKPKDVGSCAVKFLLDRAGWTESPPNSNDSVWLSHWRDALGMAWMKGQPYCGLGCIAAYHYCGKEIPKDSVYTPNIVSRARAGNGFTAVPASQAKPGDLVVFDWNPGTGADHVGLARGPARGGYIPTVEANTSPGNSGSQSNGGGIYVRSRPIGFIAVVARPK